MFTETGGVAGPRLPALSARVGRESFPLLGQPLLDGRVGVPGSVDTVQDTVTVGMRGGPHRVDGGCDTGCEQVEEVIAEGGVEVDVLGLPVQPHILDTAVLGDQETGQCQVGGQAPGHRLTVVGDLLLEQEAQQRQVPVVHESPFAGPAVILAVSCPPRGEIVRCIAIAPH